jgi:hypothetical protein
MKRLRPCQWLAIALALVVVGLGSRTAVGQARYVGLLVAPFAGPEPLGQKVATVLHLQIWQTLRLAPPNNTRKLNFGRGIVYWDEGAAPTRHPEALARLTGLDAQMVLWGRAQEFGDGVVVQAYLTVAEAPRAGAGTGALWSVSPPELAATKAAISVGLPASTFEFAPIVLRAAVIPLLSSPAGITIYEDRNFTTATGELGGDFRAIEQGPDSARVQSRGVTGWVRLPGLSANRSEVTDFSGGLIRIFRRDWGGAIDLFTRVTRTATAPVSIRVSSYLLMAAASRLQHEQIGGADQSLEFVEAAEQLNPYLRDTIKYKCMALLAGPRRAERMRRLDETVRSSEYLFPKDDPWLGKVKQVLAKNVIGPAHRGSAELRD